LSAVYALGGAAAWGFSSAYATRLRQTGLDNLSITAWSMGFGSAMLVVIAYFTPSPAIRWDSHFALILFYNAVLAMAVAWLLWAYVLERLSIMAASLGVLAVPLIGSLSSTLQLGERYSAIELVGMGAVTLSMAAVYWRPAKRSHPESITHDNLNQLRAP
jgi:probable blue pigment (indigoidine) exporter